jgi:phospholipase/lecithinase/hemolysin
VERRRQRAAAVALAFCLGAPAAAGAEPITEYVFGDSLSDTGNLYGYLGHNFPNPPSYHDSYTNGKVAVELLAERLGGRADPSLWLTGFQDVHGLFGPGFVPGSNYAVAGAQAANTSKIDLPYQVGAFLLRGHNAAPSDALYTVMIGGNDVRAAAKAGSDAGVRTGVATELAEIGSLIKAGAQRIVVGDAPNIGLIPEFAQDNPQAAPIAMQYSVEYNALLRQGLAGLAASNPGASISLFDLYAFNNDVLANAASYGFTDTTDRCYSNTGDFLANPRAVLMDTPACGPIGPDGAANIGQFIYWDSFHPTARVQALWAQGLADAARVPEPATIGLLGAGLAGLIAARRGRKRD